MAEKKQGNWFGRHKVLTVIGVIILLAIVGGAAGGGKKSATSTNSSSTANTSSPAAATEAKQPDVPAEYKSALSQAGTYANTMHMSKRGLYDQLVSEYGGKFSAPAAQYGVDNVKTDYNANALAKAKTYQDTMHLSPSAIHDQLTSDAGEKFTAAEADYAIAHL
jgi:hypothetical protein